MDFELVLHRPIETTRLIRHWKVIPNSRLTLRSYPPREACRATPMIRAQAARTNGLSRAQDIGSPSSDSVRASQRIRRLRILRRGLGVRGWILGGGEEAHGDAEAPIVGIADRHVDVDGV